MEQIEKNIIGLASRMSANFDLSLGVTKESTANSVDSSTAAPIAGLECSPAIMENLRELAARVNNDPQGEFFDSKTFLIQIIKN